MKILSRSRGQTGRLVGRGDPGPIRIDGHAPGLLALHGFANTPAEVRPLVEVARRLGRRAHAPALPGHGTSPFELQRARWEDWAAAAEHALEAIAPPSDAARHARRTVVAGLSLGSVVALHLAAARPEQIAGVVVLGCAVWLPPLWPGLALRVLGGIYRAEWDLYTPKVGCDIRDPEARSAALSYNLNPLAAAIQVERAGRIVREELGRVRCPVLILHGAKDAVCPAANVGRLCRLLGSADVEVAVLARSGHIVTMDFDREEVARRVESFVNRVAPADHRSRTPVDP